MDPEQTVGLRVTGWMGCRDALLSEQLVSDPRLAGVNVAPANNLLFMDGELHQRLRHLVMSYFTYRRVNGFRQQLQDTCQSLVRSVLIDSPHVDLLADVVEPMVLDAILTVMEVPNRHREKLGALSRDMVRLLEPTLPPMARRRTANAALRATMLFERDRLAERATGLHSALETAAQERLIPEKLARATPVVVLHGGYENPISQFGCIIAWAVQNPGRFKQAASAAPNILFEEIMRVYSPVRLLARWATENGEHGELSLRRGELVWIDLESANHDPRQFTSMDDVDLSRRRKHLGFGYGPHVCPGAALARLEGHILIDALSAVPDEILQKFAVGWRDGVVTRGPLSITRASQ